MDFKDYNYEEETDIEKLKEYVSLLESDKKNLIDINTKVSSELYAMENPERALLAITHDEERAFEGEQKLATLYQACHENRVAISDVKDAEGEVHEALCLMVPASDGDSENTLSLLPIFIIKEMGLDEEYSFPAPEGGWQSDRSGGVIEAALLAN